MNNTAGKFFIIASFLLAAVFLQECAFAQHRPLSIRTRKNVQRHKKAKAYKYKEKSDINNDGVVNSKDRLLWLRSRGKNYQKALVSTENEDIIEAMDVDGDGSVEAWEMENFYNDYDLNNDGELDDYEIEQATD